jgi:hypothetical protein
VDPDRLENLVTQVLEEARDFRQEVRDKLARVDERFARVEERFDRDIKLLQNAVLETNERVKRVEAKLDRTVLDHGARLDKLEGAAE